MKKSLIALAVLSAFAGVASAQSSVTLSGGLDAGLRNAGLAINNRASSVTTLTGAASSRNNLTFSGVEDLNNGNSAFFTLNHRYNIQSGTQNGQNATTSGVASSAKVGVANTGDDAAQFWRNAFVGLKNNDIGDVRLGRMLMPLQELNGGFEAWYGGDTVASVHTDGRSNNVATSGLRTNETIYLRSANFGGVVVHVAHAQRTGGSTQETAGVFVAGTTTADKVAPQGLGATFTFGPAVLGLATDRNGNNKKSVGLYGKYNAGVAIVYAQYERSDTNATLVDSNTDKDKRFSISADIPMGDFTFKAGYRVMNRADAAFDGSAKKLGLGLEYALSKRTKLYSNIGKTSGSNTETQNSATATQLQGDVNRKAAFDIGVWHKF